MNKTLLVELVFLFVCTFLLVFANAQSNTSNNNISVIAYYSGDASTLDNYDVKKLTHIIYSFCHLRGNQMTVANEKAGATIRKMVSLKKINPDLKVILSIGGWGGCETCSQVFSDSGNRKAFATSVKELMEKYDADGIDLDWEYPAILGYPGHRFVPEDKVHFTELIKQLRRSLGNKYEISFAAGAFPNYFDSSVEWNEVMPLVNRVNLMTYDLVNGYATTTGHHTPLYSTPEQTLSIDYGVHYLDSLGVPKNKITIGAAFYARVFENVDSINNGLYRPAKFKEGVDYKRINNTLTNENGYEHFYDSIAEAPYMYNASKKLFVTYDDTTSVRLKTLYAIKNSLDGIMFWELSLDKPNDGLLDAIYDAKKEGLKQ